MSKSAFDLSNRALYEIGHYPSFPDDAFFKNMLVTLFDELAKHGGVHKWFQGVRAAEGNFQNELAASDGHTLWLNQDFVDNNPGKALALAGHVFMHMFQWNTNAGYLHMARQRYSFRASTGEKITPEEFSQAYAYEKNAWELFLGFLQVKTSPASFKAVETWLQKQFEEDMFSTAKNGLGLTCVYGASDPETGKFYPEYEECLGHMGLDRHLRVDTLWALEFRDYAVLRKHSGIDPYILRTGHAPIARLSPSP